MVISRATSDTSGGASARDRVTSKDASDVRSALEAQLCGVFNVESSTPVDEKASSQVSESKEVGCRDPGCVRHGRPHSPDKDADRPYRAHGALCVCEICTCGNHRCHPMRKPLPFEGKTTHRTTYVPLPQPVKVSSYAWDPERTARRVQLPLDGESWYRHDYTEKPLPRRERAAPQEWKATPAKFMGESSMHMAYKAPPPEALSGNIGHAPPGTPRKPLPFAGESSYAHAYQKKELPRGSMRQPQSVPAKFRTLPFEGVSSYRNDYMQKPLAPRATAAPEAAPRPHVPFRGQSNAHSSYPAPPQQALREAFSKPAPGSARREPLQFKGQSQYRRDYTEKPLDARRPSSVPATGRHTMPFFGETSYRHDFTAKPIPRKIINPEAGPETRQPRVPFKGESTAHAAFRAPSPKEYRQTTPRRDPVPREPLPFAGEPTYSRDYTAKPLPRDPQRVEQRQQSRSRMPFRGESTSHAVHQAPPQQALLAARTSQAAPRPMHVPTPFKGESSYKAEFVRKEAHVCPVVRMPPRPSSAPPGREHTFWDKKERQWR